MPSLTTNITGIKYKSNKLSTEKIGFLATLKPFRIKMQVKCKKIGSAQQIGTSMKHFGSRKDSFHPSHKELT